MSHYQSRADRSDPQPKRSARPSSGAAHQRSSTGKGSGAGGQGPSASATPLLSPAVQPAPVPSSKRSGGVNGQPRGHMPSNVEVSESLRGQNTPSQQQVPHVSNVQSGIRTSNGSVSRSSKPGMSSSSSVLPEVAPVLPKPESAWNSVHPQLSFQFGSIGPSIGTFVQIPARTSSAPPNLDEQKQDLLRFEAANSQASKAPIPSGGQQQGPRSQGQQSGVQMQPQPNFRNQPQQSATAMSAGIPQPPYHQQGQQHPMPVQVSQPSSHLQASSVVTTQAHLPMQAHFISPLPQQQGLVQLSYSQHTSQTQLQHNGGQVTKYPQSMVGPPLMGPSLAPLPGPIPATQMTHQLPGGLAPGMPRAPYGVPVTNFMTPRTSSAVKIVDPKTHEELKFDCKTSKTDNFHDPVLVTAAGCQGRLVGNGPSHSRPPLGYGGGSHHQNVYSAQQNGPYSAAMQQHYYQPSSSGVSSKHDPVTESSLPNKMSTAPTASTTTSREMTVGSSTLLAPSVSGPSSAVVQVPASATSEKQDLSDAPSSLGTVDQVHESKADVDNKAVKTRSSEVSAAPLKDTVQVVKEAKDESSGLTSSKDSHRTDSTNLTNSDARQNNKKKKKKDGFSRSNTGDAPKVSRALEVKKQGEIKVSDAQVAEAETPKSVEQAMTSTDSAPVIAGTVPETITVIASEAESHRCNGELAVDSHRTVIDVSVSHEVETVSTKGSGSVEEAVSSNVSGLEVGSLVNSVHKAVTAEPVLSGDECIEKQSDTSTVHVECRISSNSHEVISSVLSSKSSHTTDVVECMKRLESDASNTDVNAQVNQGTCKVLEAEACGEKAIVAEAKVEVEAPSSNEACKGEGGVQAQIEPVELQSNVHGQFSLSKEEIPEDTPTSVAPDVKPSGGKKKRMKGVLAKADAAGSTCDLYNAYKAPQEKKQDELMPSKVSNVKLSTNDVVKQVVTPEESSVSKEIDDWEDAVELPSPRVLATEDVDGKGGEKQASEEKGRETYTRDFLLTFKEQNVDLPLDFELRPDIADLLLNPQAAFMRFAERDMHSGRMLDRQLSGGPRRSTPSTLDDDRWARQPQGPHSPHWPDNYSDMGLGGGFRSGSAQGLIPRMAPNIRPGIAVPPLVPGLIPGKPLTPATGPGPFRTNTVDSDRWQRMPTGQKGLIPSPQTPLPPVHKADKRYEVGKASDEEEQKQRQIKGILNKLTPQNFQKLFDQVKDVNIQSAITLTGVISQIFDKALTEPTFCEMYATFCKQLATDMPEFMENGEKVTFRRVLLNKCQEEFHRGEKEQAEASELEQDLSAEDQEEKRIKAKRRMLGNIRFIGELYKKHMLTERIMHECICKLLGDYENPEEEDVEALCKLMSTIGYMIDQPARREHIDAYLERITRLSNNHKLSARIRFMLKDLIDLRRNGWQERRKVEGPKRIEEVHRDAVQERQATVAQAGRLSRGPSIGTSSGRRLVPPPELSTRGHTSPMFAPSTPMGSVSSMRGAQPPGGMRSPYVQDVRMEDRLLMERPTPMPLSQRSVDEGPLTLGPQGGLGRGMSLRNQPSGSGVVASSGEIRRFGPGSMAAYSSGGTGVERPITPPERPLPDRPSSATADRFASGSSRSSRHLERTLSDKAPAALNPQNQQLGSHSRPSTAPAYVPLTEDQLRKKSEAALNEYFSARDLKEAIQCVEELRAPKFYPTMVFIWIGLSFEKGDFDRELLAKLLINLQKSEAPVLRKEQIIQGFQLVMESLEDSCLDTPKAPDYLAQMLVRLISAGTLALDQVADLLKISDILQSGLALDMIGKVLSGLQQDKGQRFLIELYRSSGVGLEDFFVSGNMGSKSLVDFLKDHNLQCLGPDPDHGNGINNIQQIGVQLLEHLSKNEPTSETVRWLERTAASQMHSDSSFLQMLMTQVLKHLIPAGGNEETQGREIMRKRLAQYGMLLSRFAPDKEKQHQYIVAMQLYVHGMGHPTGLMTTLFNTLYEEEVISESAFHKWEDDVDDPTIGRDKALRDVYKWLQWLRTAPEQSQDDEF